MVNLSVSYRPQITLVRICVTIVNSRSYAGDSGPGLEVSAKQRVGVSRGLARTGTLDSERSRRSRCYLQLTCHQSSFLYISPCATLSAGVECAKLIIWSRLSSIHSCRASSDAPNGA
jgi:hypothetical protein